MTEILKDELLYITSVIVFFIFLVIYLYRCYKNKSSIDILVAVQILVASGGIVISLFLMLGTIFPSIEIKLSEIKLYIFISGLVMLGLSSQTISNLIWNKPLFVRGKE